MFKSFTKPIAHLALLVMLFPFWASLAEAANNTNFKSNVIVGGTLTVTGAITNSSSVFTSPVLKTSLILKSATANDTIVWTDPAAANQFTLPDTGGNDTFAFLAATQTFTNKTLTSPVFTTPKLNGAGAGRATLQYANSATSQTVTVPDFGAADSLVGLAATQTLTNKTLTAPATTLPTIGGAGAGVATLTYANTATGRTLTIPDPGAPAILVATEGSQTINGTKTFGTPLVAASLNAAANKKIVCVPFRGLSVQALDDGTAFKTLVAPGRAGTLTQVSIAAVTVPIGGTNTVAVFKNDTTAMLAANFDPTTLTTIVASKPALNATGANLAFTTTDVISIVWTTGAQTTDAVAPTVTLEFTLTDL